MLKKILKIISFIFVFLILLIAFLFYRGQVFYNSIFRLSYEEINRSLESAVPQCTKFKDCKLLAGDIVIRRYVTNVSDIFNKTLDPYFTHSALYFGNDKLFEALGNYEKPEDQVKINKLSQSDWLDENMKNFIILRPKNNRDRIDQIIKRLKDVADDPEYTFGALKEGRKTVSCSDIILKNLSTEEIFETPPEMKEFITPDYLFWTMINNKNDFEVIGYHIEPK